MDDVLLFGANKAEHDKRLAKVLKQIATAGITLKCLIGQEISWSHY